MYVDESGDDGFNSNNTYTKGNTPTQYYIRCGVILHDRKWKKVNEAIDGWKFSNQIPKAVEIHATEILNGKEKYYDSTRKRKSRPNWWGKNLPKRLDRVNLLASLCNKISTLPITVIAIMIDKSKISLSNPTYNSLPKEALNANSFGLELVELPSIEDGFITKSSNTDSLRIVL